jgi:hypothetical protein
MVYLQKTVDSRKTCDGWLVIVAFIMHALFIFVSPRLRTEQPQYCLETAKTAGDSDQDVVSPNHCLEQSFSILSAAARAADGMSCVIIPAGPWARDNETPFIKALKKKKGIFQWN